VEYVYPAGGAASSALATTAEQSNRPKKLVKTILLDNINEAFQRWREKALPSGAGDASAVCGLLLNLEFKSGITVIAMLDLLNERK